MNEVRKFRLAQAQAAWAVRNDETMSVATKASLIDAIHRTDTEDALNELLRGNGYKVEATDGTP